MTKLNKDVKTIRGFRRVVRLVRVTKTVTTVGPIYVAFGDAIRNARTALGLRQEDLAHKVGITRASIANIETGRQRVLLGDLFIFARALKMKPQKLFGDLL